ncbi:unnamed protein product [Moneuplotes crassus]|uniref:RCC1-like domain-containing protein n=1 Tax=Euplotes crassus TaxID=5936 RepID=A0AAD1YB73_EUPCR|nr:unnamed protein product [Moneuplotes crassus]
MSSVLTYGSGECEQLGLENAPLEIKKPRAIPFFQAPMKIKEIACGGMHTILLTAQGCVYTWGCNDEGALGRVGDTTVPKIIEDIEEPITGVTCGDSHSIAYSIDKNLVYSWGLYRNTVSGPIGKIAKTPMKIAERNLKGLQLTKVMSGSHHTLMLASGRVFAWGDPESGKIGRNIKTRRRNESGLVMEPVGLKRVKDIFCSRNSSFAISEDTKGNTNLYSWGLNNWGQLGLGHNKETSKPEIIREFKNKKVLKVVGGDSHTVILVQEGAEALCEKTTKVYTVGLNDEGQLGIGDTYTEYRRNKNETNMKLDEEEKTLKQENEKKIQEIKDIPEKDLEAKEKQKEINKANNELKRKLRAIESKRNSLENSENAQYFTTVQLVEGITDSFDISAGANYSYAIRQRKIEEDSKEDAKGEETKRIDPRINQLFAWGMGENYVLCNREDESSYTPLEVKLEMLRELNPISVSCGTMHCIMRSIKIEENPEDYGLEPISQTIVDRFANDIAKEIDANRKRRRSEIENDTKPVKDDTQANEKKIHTDKSPKKLKEGQKETKEPAEEGSVKINEEEKQPKDVQHKEKAVDDKSKQKSTTNGTNGTKETQLSSKNDPRSSEITEKKEAEGDVEMKVSPKETDNLLKASPKPVSVTPSGKRVKVSETPERMVEIPKPKK